MIYFIQQGQNGPIKIGYTSNLENRISQLQTGSPEKLNVLLKIEGDYQTEKELHEKFDDLRIFGEWFRNDNFLINYINSERDKNIGNACNICNTKTTEDTFNNYFLLWYQFNHTPNGESKYSILCVDCCFNFEGLLNVEDLAKNLSYRKMQFVEIIANQEKSKNEILSNFYWKSQDKKDLANFLNSIHKYTN